MIRRWSIAVIVFLGAQTAWADSKICAVCHAKIWETYRQTGMARSFYPLRPESEVEDYTGKNSYYHQASDTYFAMVRRGGRYFQRQYQTGFDGKPTEGVEKEVDFVLGSGNHARTYLHRTPANTLVQLPLGWYAEKGGYWAMNPGYDQPDHPGLLRNVTYDCMFCHNGYPKIPAASSTPRALPVFTSVPEGIDCQRCHGDGEKHVARAQNSSSSIAQIREAIVNPSRLTAEKQMEVCLQCHLETTSSPLPASIVRYEREPFSYQPGEPLANFILHFDHAPGKGYDGKFEITGSAYRLRQSQCFQKSNGALRCTTCHDPHTSPNAEEASRKFIAACRKCHGAALDTEVNAGKHPAAADCVGCHMPKRRTDDVVHAVMTDHYIQRRKPARDLLAEIPERRQNDATAYRGPVVPYYPQNLSRPADELYLAIAQISQNSNLTDGLARLSAAINKFRPARAEYYLQLGDGLRNAGRFVEALAAYEEAVKREPESMAALERLALCLPSLRQQERAGGILKQVLQRAPSASTSLQLGLIELQEGKTSDAISAFEEAMRLDREMPDAYNLAGAIWFETGEPARAEAALRDAIRLQPNYAPAHNNLGNLLSTAGRFDEARYHFEAALRYKEDYNGARYNYALALTRVRRFDEAQTQLEAILRADPRSAEAHEFLGNLMGARGQTDAAMREYREALRLSPDFSRASLDLGSALANSGDVAAALPYLKAAAQGSDAATREEAMKVLKKLERVP
jgi:predicted CXXCH cytochrome family protein